jgi:hypothetical protein
VHRDQLLAGKLEGLNTCSGAFNPPFSLAISKELLTVNHLYTHHLF